MIRRPPILGLIAPLALLGLAGCGRPSAPAPAPVAAAVEDEASWTPEKIAANPDRYLQFADRRIRDQVGQRERRLEELAARRADVEARSSQLLRRVEEARNLRQRLDAAMLRADDEDRWPMVFAGRSFSRERSQSLREAILAFERQREPLAVAYREALQRIEQSQRALRADIASLGQVREQLALDLERVRLNQGMAELAELRKTEAKLANFSSTLAGLNDDPLAQAVDASVRDMDVNELLK